MFKNKTNKELLKLMEVMMYQDDIKLELKSRITKYAQGKSGNAYMKLFYIPKTNSDDVVIMHRIGGFFNWDDPVNDAIMLLVDDLGRIVWKKVD